MTENKPIITDDLKIMLKKAVTAIKDRDKIFFERSIQYILNNLRGRNQIFADYLYEKIIYEVEQ